MIDIHSHLLPGLDDGPKDLAASLELARLAVADGISHAVMTPHYNMRYQENTSQKVSQAVRDFQSALDIRHIPLQLSSGQEIRLTGDTARLLASDTILTIGSIGSYVLLELPSDELPMFVPEALFTIQQLGFVPILAHPERNRHLMAHPEVLATFVSRGVICQVTASSIVGHFGKAVKAFSADIISHGMAHVIASDVHDLPNRQSSMTKAYDLIQKRYGQQVAWQFEQNAQAVLAGQPVQGFEVVPIHKKKFFSLY